MHTPKNGLQKTLQIIGTYLNKSIFESSENLRFCAMYKKCALYCIYYIFLWKWEEFLDRLMFLSGGSQRLKDSLSFLGRQWTALNSWLLPVNLLADDSFSCTNMALVSKGQTVDLISISQVASSFLKEKFGLQAFWMSCSGRASVLWEETLPWCPPKSSIHLIFVARQKSTPRTGKSCCIRELLITAGQSPQCSWEGKEGRKNRNSSGLLLLSSSDFLVRKSLSFWRWEVWKWRWET